MKKIVFIIILGLAFVSLNARAQQQRSLILSDFQIEVNGQKLPSDQRLEAQISDNKPLTLILVETDSLKLGAEYVSRFAGRRMKFSRRHFVEYPNGKRLYAKRKKAVQLLNVSVKGSLDGRETETILYNRKQLKSVFISYHYELLYR